MLKKIFLFLIVLMLVSCSSTVPFVKTTRTIIYTQLPNEYFNNVASEVF